MAVRQNQTDSVEVLAVAVETAVVVVPELAVLMVHQSHHHHRTDSFFYLIKIYFGAKKHCFV